MSAVLDPSTMNGKVEIVLKGTRDMPRRLEVHLSAPYVSVSTMIRFGRGDHVRFRTTAYATALRDQCSIMTTRDGMQTLLLGDGGQGGRFPLGEGEAAVIVARIPLREWTA